MGKVVDPKQVPKRAVLVTGPKQRDSDWVNRSPYSAFLRNLTKQFSLCQKKKVLPPLSAPKAGYLGQGHLVPG